ISDNVLSLFGAADAATVDFIAAAAAKAKSEAKLRSTLAAVDLPSTDASARFVAELFRRIPRTASAQATQSSQRKDKDKETIRAIKDNAKFTLLRDEDDPPAAPVPAVKKLKKEKGRRREAGDDRGGEQDEDEGPVVVKRVRKYEDEEDAAAQAEEAARLKDIQERDEFIKRMQEKDKEKTKKLIEDNSKGSLETQKRKQLAEDAELRKQAVPELRVRARQEYLGKREEQRLLLLEREIDDEEYLFRTENLSKREKRDLEYKKEVLRLAKERMKISDKVDGYMMPDDYITEKGKLDKKKQESVLYKRYEDNEDPDAFISEQTVWEDHQIRNAKLETKAQQDEFEFDYVFDEEQHVQFIQDAVVGSDGEEEENEVNK
ncbi:hypothetical protein HDU99_007332, partial [Rhizoclosmatium hyalinum]